MITIFIINILKTIKIFRIIANYYFFKFIFQFTTIQNNYNDSHSKTLPYFDLQMNYLYFLYLFPILINLYLHIVIFTVIMIILF